MSDPQPQQDQTQTVILAALTAILVAEFGNAQSALIRTFAALIARYGVGDLLQHKMVLAARKIATILGHNVPPLVEQVIAKAAADGAKAAGPGEPTIPSFGIAGDSFESHAERSARAIREDLEGKLNALNYRITRFAADTYQAVVADAALDQAMGRLTPAEAHHAAYQKLMAQGIDGFVDSKGRNWELSAYVDMAVRTAAQRAFNVSHLDRMLSVGINYFTVSDDGHPCPLCAPWEGQVLTAGTPDDIAQATIADATAAGLFHPRCRHILVSFTPGISPEPTPNVWTPEDQAKYAESQQQRALERAIRSAKWQLDGAFTPEMKSQAQLAVRRAQANMRDFIDKTGRVRISRREQVHL